MNFFKKTAQAEKPEKSRFNKHPNFHVSFSSQLGSNVRWHLYEHKIERAQIRLSSFQTWTKAPYGADCLTFEPSCDENETWKFGIMCHVKWKDSSKLSCRINIFVIFLSYEHILIVSGTAVSQYRGSTAVVPLPLYFWSKIEVKLPR